MGCTRYGMLHDRWSQARKCCAIDWLTRCRSTACAHNLASPSLTYPASCASSTNNSDLTAEDAIRLELAAAVLLCSVLATWRIPPLPLTARSALRRRLVKGYYWCWASARWVPSASTPTLMTPRLASCCTCCLMRCITSTLQQPQLEQECISQTRCPGHAYEPLLSIVHSADHAMLQAGLPMIAGNAAAFGCLRLQSASTQKFFCAPDLQRYRNLMPEHLQARGAPASQSCHLVAGQWLCSF